MPDSLINPQNRRETDDGIVYFERAHLIHNDTTYRRLAIHTHFIEIGECYLELAKKYVAPVARPGDILSISEKIIAMCQQQVVHRKDIKVGFWAKLLSKFARGNIHGPGVSEAPKMQLAINLAGLPRILFASFMGALGKFIGKRGLFYKIAGHGIAGIDGLYPDSDFEIYKNMALLNPANPEKVCQELEDLLNIGVMLVDANDLNVEIFGKSSLLKNLSDEDLCGTIMDNPAGQNAELTPFILIRNTTYQ